MKGILDQFYALSGLRTNSTKHEMFLSEVSDYNSNLLHQTSGFKSPLHVKYLGVHLISGRLSQVDWNL